MAKKPILTKNNGRIENVIPQTRYNLEVAIETERIKNVLNQTYADLEIALCCPLLLEDDGILLYKHLQPTEISEVLKAFMPYLTCSHEPASILRHQTVDFELNRGLESLRQEILQHQSQMTPISPAAAIFLHYVKQLQHCLEARLSVTPEMEKAQNENLKLIWNRNEEAKKVIVELRNTLEAQRNEGNTLLAEKMLIINKHQEHIEQLKRQCKENIKKRINESEHNILSDQKNSQYIQDLIKIDIQDSEEQFKQLLSAHIQEERDLKIMKTTIESQLASLINQYDIDIAQKQIEWEKVTAQFEAEKLQMAELQKQFNAQEIEYRQLMTEKAADEQREFDQKMYIFIINRSARKIQRAWRAYKQRKLTRRKGKKKRKGGSGKGSKQK